MSYVALADRDHDVEHHDPQTFITKYIWSQDHKVIAVQYGCTAVFVGIIALCLSAMMRLQLGFPDEFAFINPENYYQFITMHGMIMVIYLLTALFLGGFGNYLIPLMCGSRDMVFPYLNMLSYWVYLLSVLILLASFFVPGGATGAGWTLYPPQAIMPGTPGVDWGIVLMLLSLAVFIVAFTMGGLNYITTVLQARCRGMTLMRMPLSVWGIFMAKSYSVPALVLVLWSSRSLYCGAAGIRYRVRSPEYPRTQEYFRLPHDGMGHYRDRRAVIRGLGASHVRVRHAPLFRLFLRHDDTDHCGANRHQGL